MEITKAVVVARLDELKKQFQRLEMDAVATNGAIQDCEHWLRVLEAQATEEAPH